MREYCTVLMLAARGVLWKLLAIAAAVAAAQGALFALFWRAYPPEAPYYARLYYGLEYMVQESRLAVPAAAGLAALSLALAFHGRERAGSRSRYTLDRLGVNPRHILLLWAGCYALCLLVYWGFQAAAALGLCRVMTAGGWVADDMQTLSLACWRSPYLHILFPLSDWIQLLSNGVLLLSLALAASSFSFLQRHGQPCFEFFGIAALLPVLVIVPPNALEIAPVFGGIAALCAISAFTRAWRCPEYES